MSDTVAPAAPKSQYLRDAWLIMLLAVVYGGGLALTQLTLTPIIEANKLNESLKAVPDLVPGAVAEHTEQRQLGALSGFVARDANGQVCGYVVKVAGSGFADRIELLVGLNASGSTITGLRVIEQKETPGLGDYITSASFSDRFAGKATSEPLVARRGSAQGPAEFQALTGATVSSQSVADIVNRAVATVKPLLTEGQP